MLKRDEIKKSAINSWLYHLKVIRQEKHLSQEKLGEIASVDGKHIGRLESGENMPNILTLWEVCEALGVSLIDFAIYVEGIVSNER